MLNHWLMSIQFHHSSVCATFSGHISRILQWLLPLSSNWQETIWATKGDNCQRTPWMLSAPCKTHWRQNQSWLFHVPTDNMLSLQMRPLGRLTLQVVSVQFSHKRTILTTTTQFWTLLANSRITKNYSPFLLESAPAVWGMDVFNKYLKGKKFILFTDHKPLEKMGHLHTKTMNWLKAALLGHDFVIQCKKVKSRQLTTSPSCLLLTTPK